MRQPVRALLSLCVLSQLFFACKKDDKQATPPGSEPGYFVVSSMSQASAANARIANLPSPSATEFDLGQLRASKEFLFTITNGGDMPIFDVALTSDNAPFDITPKTIKSVPGKKQTGIMPLLTVGITHGRQLNGTAKAAVLSMGQNSATIKLTGKTLKDKDTIVVTGEFKVTINAKVFGVKLLPFNQEPIAIDNNAYVVSHTKGLKIINTGNIKIHPKVSYTGYVNEFDLEPGQEKDITNMLHPFRNVEYYPDYTDIRIFDEGVVIDTAVIPNWYIDNVVIFNLKEMKQN
jgi:hypothetical protein